MIKLIQNRRVAKQAAVHLQGAYFWRTTPGRR